MDFLLTNLSKLKEGFLCTLLTKLSKLKERFLCTFYLLSKLKEGFLCQNRVNILSSHILI